MFLKKIIRTNTKEFIIRFLVTFLMSWAIHTYILAFKLDGFNYVINNRWSEYVATDRSSHLLMAFLWFLFGFLFWSTVDCVRYYGLKKYCHLLVKTPFHILKEIRLLSYERLFFLIGFIGCGFLLSTVFGAALSLTLGVVLIFIIGTFFGDLLLRVLFWSFHKLLKLFHKTMLLTKSFAKILIFIFGITLILSAFIPLKWLFGLVLVGAATVAILRKNNTRVTHIFFLVLGGTILFSLLDVQHVFADDGGWSEAGGSFKKWLMSSGFLELIKQGILPALSAALAAFLPSTAFAAESQWGPPSTWDARNVERLKGCHPDIIQNAIDFINHVEKEMGLRLRISDDRVKDIPGGFRTIKQQENAKAEGDSTTKAGGGSSWHNYGRAIDVLSFNKDGSIQGLNRDTWTHVYEIAKQHGFDDWGGGWRDKNGKLSTDFGHFGNKGGRNIDDLKKAYQEQKNLYPNKSENEIALGL